MMFLPEHIFYQLPQCCGTSCKLVTEAIRIGVDLKVSQAAATHIQAFQKAGHSPVQALKIVSPQGKASSHSSTKKEQPRIDALVRNGGEHIENTLIHVKDYFQEILPLFGEIYAPQR